MLTNSKIKAFIRKFYPLSFDYKDIKVFGKKVTTFYVYSEINELHYIAYKHKLNIFQTLLIKGVK